MSKNHECISDCVTLHIADVEILQQIREIFNLLVALSIRSLLLYFNLHKSGGPRDLNIPQASPLMWFKIIREDTNPQTSSSTGQSKTGLDCLIMKHSNLFKTMAMTFSAFTTFVQCFHSQTRFSNLYGRDLEYGE